MLNLYRDVFRCLNSHEVRYLVSTLAASLPDDPEDVRALEAMPQPVPGA